MNKPDKIDGVIGKPKERCVFPVEHCAGKWIWDQGDTEPYHFFLFCRRNFEVVEAVKTALLHISASDRYMVWLNGSYLGRGPARSLPEYKSFDTYQVAEHLQQGKNVLAIRAYYYGKPPPELDTEKGLAWEGMVPHVAFPGNYYACGERAGVWAQLEAVTAEDNTFVVGTDAEWRLLPAEGWRRDVLQIKKRKGSTEIYDGSADPVDWNKVEFDDSGWEKSCFAPEAARPWINMESRYTPLMDEREVFPARVVKVGEAVNDALGSSTGIPELLNSEIHLPLEVASIENARTALISTGGPALLQSGFEEGIGVRDPFIIVDFGRQLFGFPKVKLRAKLGAIIDVNYGQQLIGGRIPPINPGFARCGDRFIARDGEQVWEQYEYKQFRYLQVTVRSLQSPVEIDSITLNEYAYPAKQRGRFESSDPLLDKLWQAAVDTTYLHMEDTLVCDAWRERVAHAQIYSIGAINGVYMAYGDLPVTDRKLLVTPLMACEDGLLEQKFPIDAPERNISNGQTEWPKNIRRHYLHTGRKAVIEYLYPTVVRLIDWFEPHRGEFGLLGHLPPRTWVDWAPNDIRGLVFINNALYVNGLDEAALLADELGKEKDAARWRAIAEEVRVAARKVFWNPDRGLYEDSYHNGKLTGVASELANGLALLYDIATEDQIPAIARSFNDPKSNLVEVTILCIPHVLDGLIKAGLTQIALDLIRQRFHYMLNCTDNPTLWESWGPYSRGPNIIDDADFQSRTENYIEPHPGRSLVICSAVIAGYVLTTRILGVMPIEPGLRKCRIQPRLGDLRWAKGVVPTPQGDIAMEWERTESSLEIYVELPTGVMAEVVLDREEVKGQSLTHNGSKWDIEGQEDNLPDALKVSAGEVCLQIPEGEHKITISTND